MAVRDTDPFRGIDPVRDLADDCLDALAGLARLEARTAALKVRLAADYVHATRALTPPSLRDTCQEMALTAEVAGVLTVSERTADAFLGDCQALTTSLPLTLAALEAGTISWQHARILVDETTNLDPAGTAGLEAHFLDPDAPGAARGCPAGELVPGRFRAKARLWRERSHPVSIEKRHTKCVGDRRVEFLPDRDGMAWFSAYLPAGTAAGIWDRTTAAARALQGPDEARTLTQLRADIAATLLLTGTAGGVPSPRAQVLITVPVLSLLGVTGEPAVLDGYGPIPPSMARGLVADGAGSFYRVLTDPRDGAPLEIGRTRYRLTKAQRRWLSLRDGKCPFPGCNNASLDNDADHLLAWAAGGTTGISNLGQPCPRHHKLKHGSAWTPSGASKDKPPGWTSPSGRYYPSEEQDWEPPHWPDGLLTTDANTDKFTDTFTEMDADAGLDQGPPADPGHYPEPPPAGPFGPDPGPDPDQELPADPIPDWHLFMAAHEFPAAEPEDPVYPEDLDWQDSLDDAFTESALPRCA
ncbi:HNH endonuclease signature motif containing protein [Arthrobacter sp. SO3]|uniref:HNH endonuclease signature motif containing protein n=1 Tax=Arthrobacter sp. SO3 TaxID=1897057 RepID=UPI001CFFBEFB|nr:HNH endonuclease signature motif containing protein [Arthrobacter sp. SO3]